MTTPPSGAIIIGASSGIGAALADDLARRGYRLALVARRASELDAIAARLNAATPNTARVYPHDTRDYDSTPALFTQICANLGETPLTLLIYASGVLGATRPDGQSFPAEREIIETNLIGAMRWLGLAADHFVRQGRGSVVGVSSVAGDRGRAGNAAYMASKAGLSTYLESLRYAVSRKGVRVVTIKPGFVATPMLGEAKPPRPLVISAEQAARRIAEVCERGPEVIYVPARWGGVMMIVRALPSFVMKRLTI